MGLSINIANVVAVDLDGEQGLFILDPSNGKVYSFSASEVDPSTAGRIVMAATGQARSEMFEIPQDQIADVMRAKDRVMEDNKGAFAGGSFNARG